MSRKESLLLRRRVHHWKCDRPIPFHGSGAESNLVGYLPWVRQLLEDYWGTPTPVELGPGQGNHLTYLAKFQGKSWFIRIDDSPERDVYLKVESHLHEMVRAQGVPTPKIQHVDTTRTIYPFAWQIMEHVEVPDLNCHYKRGDLLVEPIARQLGEAIGKWQTIRPSGFGPFAPRILQTEKRLVGFHRQYADYFFLHLERHLDMLTQSQMLSFEESIAIEHEIMAHAQLLDLKQGCLVHKDLALWNLLGTPDQIQSVIDWDDAIAGDPMDDFSLLACFHGPEWILPALDAYQAIQPLPQHHTQRFWLHLLRNMISKAVIRVGSGHFERDESFFLTPPGTDLKTFTRQRLRQAVEGLRGGYPIEALS